jgi:tetratricopeptide (TPR) repeat protein
VQEAYLKGRYHLNKGSEEEIKKGIEYFQQALAKDPQDARSYAGLADSYVAMSDSYLTPAETMPQAKQAAQKALNVDENLAEAHTSLGAVGFLYDWDWAGAQKELKRAIELNPGFADAHVWYGVFLAQMGRSDEAVSQIKLAEAVDPLSLGVHVNAGWVYFLARQNQQAIEEWRKALDLEPKFAVAHTSIWAAYLQNTNFTKALAESGSEDSPLRLAALVGTLAVSGNKAQAEETLSKLQSISNQHYVCPYEMATGHAVLGNNNEAIRWLQKGYQERSQCMADMKTDPRLDTLRADPRFQELLRKLGFPP